jgi:hypothetical protein
MDMEFRQRECKVSSHVGHRVTMDCGDLEPTKYIANTLRDQDVDTLTLKGNCQLAFADLAMIEGSSIRLHSFERCINMKHMRWTRPLLLVMRAPSITTKASKPEPLLFPYKEIVQAPHGGLS